MKVVFQRVRAAKVEAEGFPAASIGPGALLLVGVEVGDTPLASKRMAEKCARLRVFSDEQGRMNCSLLDTGGEVLAIPNFTLCADCRHGRRPEYLAAARPDEAKPLFDRLADDLRSVGIARVAVGMFGAHMAVHMEGDGPVTIWLDTNDWK